jgi:ADP-ribosyl-[dinitrogen reductase] hydrolase
MFAKETVPPSPIPNSFWIEPGRLLAGEYPGSPSSEESIERLEVLVEAGVSYFLDLTQEGELPGYAHLLTQIRQDPASSGRALPGLTHARWPIEDHGLPDSDELMRDILDDLDRALGAGHLVYVHCRAGIGRTNTVTGCWLRRQGLAGPAAIKRLNRLWKANARSATWSRVPEFHQEQFVLNWQEPATDAAPKPAPVRKLRGIGEQQRYAGAVYGTACGDALGALVQGRKAGSFTAVTDLAAGGTLKLPRGAWTDDTAMFLCLAHSLLDKNGFDAAHQAEKYWDWHQEGLLSATGQPLGKVAAISKALAATRWSGNPFSGPHDPKLWDAESLVRVGAVVLYARRAPLQAIEWAADASRVTLQSPGVLDACRYYAAVLLAALKGTGKQDLALEAGRILGRNYTKPLKPEIASLAQSTILPTNAPGIATPTVLAALHRVLWVLSETSDFREGLIKVVNLGGHSDVQGALFGQLAGILYGLEAIPAAWRSALLQADLLESTAYRLLAGASARGR